jgi:diguanylate cyclase (GGDEF)-like protein
VYQRIKSILLFLIFGLLWARYFFMIWDPYYGGFPLEQGLPPYRDWRPFFDLIYTGSYYLVLPIYTLYGWLAPFIPKLSWFPGSPTASVLQTVTTEITKIPALAERAAALQTPVIQQAMRGYIDFLTLIAMGFYRILSPLLDLILDWFKNVLWTLMIEFSFTKRKEGRYQEALEKRAADLMKLKVEYKNLSKEANMLAQSVITDELTQVYNKRFFIEKITFEFKTAKDKKQLLAVAMVDIDHFKKLNDTYGHLVGDKVLKSVAQVAKASTPAGCFCCRFGGEEFSIIMPGKTQEEAVAIISKVHQSLPLLRFDDDANLRTSASFGICAADFKLPEAQALKSFEDMLKLADDGLYQAKLNGRNRIECIPLPPLT